MEILSGLIGLGVLIIFFVKLFQIVSILREQTEVLRDRLPEPKPKPKNETLSGPPKSFEQLFNPKE